MIEYEEPQRDEEGRWSHSAFDDLFGDREQLEQQEMDDWLAEHNIEIEINSMEQDLEDTDPVWVNYFDNCSSDFSGWKPEPPGDEYHMLSILDNEDGPLVIWYREIPES